MPVALLWGWDLANNVWVPLQVDADGIVLVDRLEIVVATFVVAAMDSVDPTRADYQCPGVNDYIKFQEAIDALP